MRDHASVTARGHQGAGRGHNTYIAPAPEYRAPTTQACGLYPFAVGATAPNIGVPLGKHLRSGTTVCGDPVSWFTRARLMSNPSWIVLGRPGLGKSSLTRRVVTGLAPQAVPLILGDLKPDYVDLVQALGGHVIRLGRGAGALNILESPLDDAAGRLGGAAGNVLREEAHGRRMGVIHGLLAVVRGQHAQDHESNILSAALRLLAKRWTRRKHAPLLRDLIALIEQAPDEIRLVTLDRGNIDRYHEAVDPLLRSLMALCDGPLGAMFARPTTERLQLDATAVCVDVSSISASDRQLQAAALLACWAEGFGAVEANNALADAGAAPQRTFLVVLDELWRVLRAGEGLVDRVDELTRLNRTTGVSQILVTHSLADMRALDSHADREKARGFVERAGAIVCFGLPSQELDDLDDIVGFSDEERRLITSWSTPPGWAVADEPPGRGCCILKVGERPGIPVHVDLVPSEQGLHNTSRRWTDK